MGKKLMKSIFRDIEYENGLINDLSRITESANKCIGFNILKEFGCAAARNIDKAAMSSIENNDTKTSTCTTGIIPAKILFNK